jgi:hypothetical protein
LSQPYASQSLLATFLWIKRHIEPFGSSGILNSNFTDTLTNIESLLREADEKNCSLVGRKS